jgi:hypothetical protein
LDVEIEKRCRVCELLKLGVFGFGLLEDWHVGIGVFPKR